MKINFSMKFYFNPKYFQLDSIYKKITKQGSHISLIFSGTSTLFNFL